MKSRCQPAIGSLPGAAPGCLLPPGHLLLLDPATSPEDPMIQSLQASGWELTITPNLAGARALLGARAPDIVLTSLTLPDTLAPDLLAALAGPYPIVLWGDADAPAQIRAALAAGASDWLPKPKITGDSLPLLLDQIRRRHALARDHQRTETTLRDELRRLDSIIDGTQVSAWEWNVQTGETVFSESWAAIAGYTLAELAPLSIHTWIDLVHPDDLPRSDQLLKQHFAGTLSHYDCECRIRHKDGSWRWVHDRGKLASRTSDGAPLMMFGTHADITERKLAEQALRDSETRLHRAEQIAGVGHFEYLLVSGMVRFSENTRTLCGLHEPESPLEEVLTLLDPRESHKLRPALVAAIEQARPIDLQFSFHRPTDLTTHTLHLIADYDAVRNAVFGVIHDVTERQQLLTELHEKSFYLERAQESANIGAYKYDLASRFWTTTAKLTEIFGVNEDYPHDFAGWLGLIAPSHRDELAAYFQDHVIARAQRFDREYPIIRPNDGQVRWLHGTGELEFDEFGQPAFLIGLIQDITERRQAAESLQLSEQRFRSILHNIHFVAVQSYAPDGTVQYWNPASERLYGYTTEEAVGRNLLDLIIPPEMHDGVRQAMAAMLQTGESIPAGELLLRHKDGSRISVFSSHALVRQPGQPPELFCVDVDLTELRRAEDRVRLQANALDAAANAIVITDCSGRIEWTNSAFASLSGYALLESVGRDLSDLIGSGHQGAAFFRRMWDTILAGQVWQGELVNRHKDGHLWTEEMTITPIRGTDGTISHFIAVKQDITQRKLLQEQIRQAQKMDAIGQLAGGVAHDFNNILAAVLMYLGLIQDEPKLDPAVRNSLKDLTREIHRGAALTRQLLAFSRQQAMQPRRSDLPEIVSGLLKMLRRLLGENITITVQAEPGLPGIEADIGMIEQVIVNLCINARDAMPQGGALHLHIDAVDFSPETAGTKGPMRPGRFVRLRVIDSGEGMAPETLEHIFEPFFTTKGEGRGTGLGLAIVYGIIQQHQGWIAAESRPGQGSVFTVYLPASAVAAAPTRATDGTRPPPGRGETILLVEDELSLRATVALALRHHGYQVLEADDGPTALAQARRHPHRIDLLLTDLVLPHGMTGMDIVNHLLASRPGLKVITSTGYSRQEPVLDDGRNITLLRKPYDQDQLLHQIRNSLDRP